VVVVSAAHSGEASHRVLQLVTDSIPRALGISGADIQVITPVRGGPAGTTELNRVLKQRLNPGPGRHGGLDPGDRVVCVADHPDDGLAQGELGTVTGPQDGGLLVAFPDGPVCVPERLLGALRPGWALTPRRAQGAQWPAVVAVFPAEAAGPAAGVHRADPGAASPVPGARGRPGAGQRGRHRRRAATGDPAGCPPGRGGLARA
jgi:exodeoxyribonuclease V alpha subunit